MKLKRTKRQGSGIAAFLNSAWRILAGSGASLGKRLRRAAPLIVIFIVLTILLDTAGWLSGFGSAALDTFLLLKKPLEAEHVVLVSITKDDYKEYFGEKSPLDPARLKQIIDAVAKGHPAVIGVDLDTSSTIFRDLQPPSSSPVVWARDAEMIATDGQGVKQKSFAQIARGLLTRILPFLFKPEEQRFNVSNVLGRSSKEFPSGLALVPRDGDSTIRRYRRQFKTTEPDSPVMDSFSWAIVKEYRRRAGHKVEEAEEGEEDWVLNAAVDEYSFKPITTIKPLLDNLSDSEGWQGDRGPIKDKIVLIGGMYPTSRDQHYTLDGPKYGVELLAYAIESDLQGKNIRPPSKYWVWFSELLVGFALVLVHARFKERPKQLRYTLIAIPVLALLASFLIFSSLALWAIFLPVLLAVLIHQLSEDVKGYRKHKINELYGEMAGFGQDVKQMLTTVGESPAGISPSPEGNAEPENSPGPNGGASQSVDRRQTLEVATESEGKVTRTGDKPRGRIRGRRHRRK